MSRSFRKRRESISKREVKNQKSEIEQMNELKVKGEKQEGRRTEGVIVRSTIFGLS